MKNPFRRTMKQDNVASHGRALVEVGTKLHYPGKADEFTVVAIRFHWADKWQESDVVFEVENAEGFRHRDVYYHFELPTVDESDTVYGFSL